MRANSVNIGTIDNGSHISSKNGLAMRAKPNPVVPLATEATSTIRATGIRIDGSGTLVGRPSGEVIPTDGHIVTLERFIARAIHPVIR